MAVQAQADQVRLNPPTVRFEPEAQVVHIPAHNSNMGMARGHHHTMSAPAIHTPRENKRHGWYHGPVGGDLPAERRVDRMVHPNLAEGFSGFPSRVPQTVHEQQPLVTEPRDNPDPMRRLEALVAVATNESTATAC
jgi:C2H2 transcription facotor